jgi:hypothetical protein
MLHLRTITGGLFALWTILLLPLASCTSSNTVFYPTEHRGPILFQSDGSEVAIAKLKYVEKNPAYQKMLSDLQATAEKDLKDGPYSIVNKQHSLSGVDPHDYVSLAPYFWPNPDTPNHLPYVPTTASVILKLIITMLTPSVKWPATFTDSLWPAISPTTIAIAIVPLC